MDQAQQLRNIVKTGKTKRPLARVITVTSGKGGVGKTTSCVNIAAQIANKGKKVLMIDMDPQGNATSGVGVDKETAENSVYNVLINGADVSDAIIKAKASALVIHGRTKENNW